MKNERHESSERDTPMVTVWTPWGEQHVPRADSRPASLKRMVRRMRDTEAAKREPLALN
ncbi:MAG TPA: hypothetical protein VGN97_20755 [Mesorhizobium sp.]|nr:hypothetical protein [Mesorhizobium sp.]